MILYLIKFLSGESMFKNRLSALQNKFFSGKHFFFEDFRFQLSVRKGFENNNY